MEKILTIDAETHDPHLKTYGAGWAFKCNFPRFEFEVLGFAYITWNGTKGYTNDWKEIQDLLDSHDALLMHNSIYDLGCLLSLASEGKLTFDIKTHVKYDTLIMAKLWNQNFFSYGLDKLSKMLLKTAKKSDLLHEWAWSTGLYQDNRKAKTGRNVHT